MRIISLCLTVAGLFFCTVAGAQITFKTEYIAGSQYMYLPNDEAKPEKVGNASGSSLVYSGSANIPFYMKMNGNNRPTAWGIGLGGSYASLDNRGFTGDMVSEIMNLQLGLFHTRPLGDRMSMMITIGAGVFAPFARVSKIGREHLLGSGGLILIWHLRPNFDLGVGVAANNSLGYPMVFPALYLDWRLEGRFKVNVSMMEGIELAAGYEFSDWFRLSLAFEMNGQMALLVQDGKRMMFSHQYMVAGLKPEVKLGKSGLSLFAMAGLNVMRPAEYSELTLRAMFVSVDSYYFRPSPYVSAGIKFGF